MGKQNLEGAFDDKLWKTLMTEPFGALNSSGC